ncbi:sugar ABC transporter substrate-binding protein [Salsuginibacillus kocurii]|uniref:sugar ABC transporter substrate-binding protein n=1 Tax=Salsuginibacillus kocurii TaxID=427078 RepID=UPI00035D6180|nr:sugar ABC transporter substrate-binding protein [Salsuginibacillus kocurii]
MKRKHSLISTTVGLLFVAGLTACGAEQDAGGDPEDVDTGGETEEAEGETEEVGDADADIRIGMSVLDLGNPFFVSLTEDVEAIAEEDGYEVIINDPQDDVNQQIDAIQNFVSQGVDAIIVTATDQNAIDDAVTEATEADIPVIAHTTMLENADAWVGADEYDMGTALGEQAGDWINEVHDGAGEVGIINFDQIEQVIDRKEGIIDGIKEQADGAEVVGDQQAGDPNAAYEVSEGFIQANPDLVGIFSFNDAGALGAANAAEAAGLDDEEFAVGGIDAVPEAIEAIRDGGHLKFTVDQQPDLTAETLMDVTNAILNDEDYEEENEIEVQPVSEDNIDDF